LLTANQKMKHGTALEFLHARIKCWWPAAKGECFSSTYGGVREVFCHPASPLIVSVGLDRFIRVHHLDSKVPVHKAYLKSRLNAIVVRKDFHLVDIDEQETHAVADKEASVATAASDSLWNEMEVICEEKGSPRKSRKRKA